jgi:hypothetical protein
VDGLSFKEGSGVQLHEMTVREAVNCAYSHIVKDMREEDRAARMAGHQFDEDLNERIERFEEKIGLRPAHDSLALWMHKHVLLPARGYTEEQIAEMFDEGAKSTLPAGISEADRWRFEDYEWDGLADFQGNPWELPGMNEQRLQEVKQRTEQAKERKDTLG